MIEGLDCANCAAKIEKRLNTLEGVDECTITFASKQLRLTAKNPDSLIPAVKAAIVAAVARSAAHTPIFIPVFIILSPLWVNY